MAITREEQFLERHRKREEERLKKREDQARFSEQVNAFWMQFQDQRQVILEACSTSENEDEDLQLRKDQLPLIRTYINQLQRFSTEATSYLPFYDTRRTQEEISSLLSLYEHAKNHLEPTRRFRFSQAAKDAVQQGLRREQKGSVEGEERAEGEVEASPGFVLDGSDEMNSTAHIGTDSTQESQHQAMKTVYIGAEQLGDSEEVVLRHLSHCHVILTEPIRFLRLSHVSHCYVHFEQLPTTSSSSSSSSFSFLGIEGPLYATHVHHSRLEVTCRQCRIHNSTHTTFSLLLLSSPIIEDCDELIFTPLRHTMFVKEEEGSLWKQRNKWREVLDFNWHKSQASPHYRLEEQEEEEEVEEEEAATEEVKEVEVQEEEVKEVQEDEEEDQDSSDDEM